MVTAIAVTSLVTILSIVLVTFALTETRQSGRERQRAGAVAFAEGQVDTMLATIQSASPATLPCTSGTTTIASDSTVSAPDVLTATTTVKYFDAAGATFTCAAVQAGADVDTALVRTTAEADQLADTGAARRTVETLIEMSPQVAGLDSAIFGDAGVTLNNKVEVIGESGTNNADIYTNGSFLCDNHQEYDGSILAQGSIMLASTCTLRKDAWAKNGVTATDKKALVQGDVKVSSGNAAFDKGVGVAGTVAVSGTIGSSGWFADNCGGTKCSFGASVPPPPVRQFPQIEWNDTVRAAWVAAGYTYQPFTDCANVSQGIKNLAESGTADLVVYTPCAVDTSKISTIDMNKNLAVFAAGGFSFQNSVTIRSNNADSRSLYLIHPYNATCPASGIGIQLNNLVRVESTVDMLLYTPCDLDKRNQSEIYGQIYAGGTATFDNQTTLRFQPLPLPDMVIANPELVGHDIDIVYKRENTG